MNEFNLLFRRRIGMPPKEPITIDNLGHVLELSARSLPFGNLRIIAEQTCDMTKENLMNNLLSDPRGGLCYELNASLYLFLIDNGFHAVLTRGIVYNSDSREYQAMGRTHATILLAHEGQTYWVDTGFGGNLPLKPVPLSGEIVSSRNGQFRIARSNSVYGDYMFEMKLRDKDTRWKKGYAFDSKHPAKDISELNEIQTTIANHEQSPFNKHPLITKLTEDGSVTLTDTSFTQWIDGVRYKESINQTRFKELLKRHFEIGT